MPRLPSCMKLLYLPLTLFILLSFMAGELYAQHQFYYKDHFDERNVFLKNPTCMSEDDQGFYWIGTKAGLYRFDGSKAQLIEFPFSDSILSQAMDIRAIAFDATRQLLWLGTGIGMIRYDVLQNDIQLLRPDQWFKPNEYKRTGSTVIYIDRQGEIWADFAVKGLVHIDDVDKKATVFRCVPGQLPKDLPPQSDYVNTIKCITQDIQNDSILWLGTRGGLIRFNKQTGRMLHYYFVHPNRIIMRNTNPVTHILAHEDGKIYLGTWNGGLLVFDPKTERFSQHLLFPQSNIEKEILNHVKTVTAISADEILLGSLGNASWLFNVKKSSIRKLPFTAKIDFRDKSNNYWVFERNGLSLYHHLKNQIPRIPFPDSTYRPTQVLRVCLDTSSHQLFLRAGGLNFIPVYDLKTRVWHKIKNPQNTSEILGGNMLAKYNDGIFFNDNWRFYYIPRHGKYARRLSFSLSDKTGWLACVQPTLRDIYISNFRGEFAWLQTESKQLLRWGAAQVNEPYRDYFTSVEVQTNDRHGKIWMKCSGGFSIFDPATCTFKHFPIQHEKQKYLARVDAMSMDAKGKLWMGNEQEIGYMDADHPENGLIQRFGAQNGHPALGLFESFIKDYRGRFWLKHPKHFTAFDPFTFQYTIYEGYENDLINEMEGSRLLVFRHIKGIGIVDPDSIRANKEVPKPYVSSLMVFSENRNLAGNLFSPAKLYLAPDENFFTLGFSALGIFNPHEFRFAYQLVGIDKDWVYPPDHVRLAGYTNVPGGEYVFRLKVCNSLGVWNPRPFEWAIHVGTPWYARWWFKGVILLSTVLVVYFWVKSRFDRQQILLENQRLQLEKEHSLRLERDRISAEMHDDLGAGLSTIRLLSLSAKRNETDPEKSKRIDKIAQTASDVMESMADIIWMMNSRNDTLENFIGYIRRQSADFLDTHGLQFQFICPPVPDNIRLDGEIRRNLLLVIKECLHNTVKHAQATTVTLQFDLDRQLNMIIQDDGKGITARAPTETSGGRNGLINMKHRIERIGGNMQWYNDHGLCVRVETNIDLFNPKQRRR